MSVYSNALRGPDDLVGWIAEGPVDARRAQDGLRLASAGGPEAHWTLWCPEEFGDRIAISWDFSPRAEPGLAMLFFGATSLLGGSIFDPSLSPRDGGYPQYHSGELRTLHASYFRRRWPDERSFHTCNLRKSPGFQLVASGADPVPPALDADGRFYRVEVLKDGARVRLAIDGLPLFDWRDDEVDGPLIGSGRIGFRQMAPLVAHYRDLEVRTL
ncbi:DUF1961 family protein [Arenivirga flava]|uniref:DUF1961 family protein n=1 Tax=Arenivirga flava TaxID=1930060 RepID=A0AA37XB05_9MICO|nr:DUF1961 family protein [Arenivirga flava]GMA27870.1 hypothetical protein GCM10025874_11230 [Arenivirga flava]